MEKFLSEEQQRLADEETKRETERKAMEMADNWRERGLDMMMGGVLQVKKEDELKKVSHSFIFHITRNLFFFMRIKTKIKHV